MSSVENKFLEWFENNDNFINTDIKELAYEMACIAENDYEEKLIKADHNVHRMPHKFKHHELFLQEIQQLQAENTAQAKTIEELNKTIYVAHGLLNGKEKEIVGKFLKLQDMQNECDTCIRQDCEVARLGKENETIKGINKELADMVNNLKSKLTANRFIFYTKVRNEYLDKIEDLELQRDGQSVTITELKKELDSNIFMRENIDLKSKLANAKETIKNFVEEDQKQCDYIANIKTLNRQEVERLFDRFMSDFILDSDKDDCIFEPRQLQLMGLHIKEYVTAICKLAIPVIDKEKILKSLNQSFAYGQMIGFDTGLRPAEWEEQATDLQKECKQNLLNASADEIMKSIGGK